MTLFRESEDLDGEAETLGYLGELLLTCATPAAAQHRFTAALAIAQNIGTPPHEARAPEGIGRCALRQGHHDEGITHLRKALAIYRRINSPNATRVETTLREHPNDPETRLAGRGQRVAVPEVGTCPLERVEADGLREDPVVDFGVERPRRAARRG
jgi:hypothetical protein